MTATQKKNWILGIYERFTFIIDFHLEACDVKEHFPTVSTYMLFGCFGRVRRVMPALFMTSEVGTVVHSGSAFITN